MMNVSQVITYALIGLSPIAATAQQSIADAEKTATSIAIATPSAVEVYSPAQQRIAAAERLVKADPRSLQAYVDLSAAYLRRSRETANTRYLEDAGRAITQGLNLDPSDFQLQKLQVEWMLRRHQYTEALVKAKALNQRTPDDTMTYGYVAEADMALGNYAEAETSAQWMMNLRQNNIPALMIGARLRVLWGDLDGAIQFLNLAYAETSPLELEEQAWIANQIAAIQIDTGHLEAARQSLVLAEQAFPRYTYTVENQAQLNMAEHRPAEAAELWARVRSNDSDPHILYLLAKSQEAAGLKVDSQIRLAEFAKAAEGAADSSGDGLPDLILVYAGTPANAAKALALADRAILSRQDVWTLDAYAWALYRNGKEQQADAAIRRAMAPGIQSAQIFDHAGQIAQKLGNDPEAAKFFELAMRSNPASDFAADARQALKLPTTPVQVSVSKMENTLSKSDVVHAEEPAVISAVTPASDKAMPTFRPIAVSLLTPRSTGTDLVIRNTQAKVAANPKDAKMLAALGSAYFQRARETGDVSDYSQAEQALNQSLDLNRAEFSADAAFATMAEVCMGEHRFSDALDYSHQALALESGDVSPFAVIGDAYADMGEYEKALHAYQRLTPPEMTLSPRAAYARDSRLSYLKFIDGDTASAIALMKVAVGEGIEANLPSENLAWLYYELGEYFTQAGDAAAADEAYLNALTTHPGDYRALAGLAKLRSNHGRYDEAIQLYQRAIAVVPMPTFVAELGDLYARVGRQADAKKQYQLVEYIGLLGHINQVLHNRDLAVFYADHDIKLAEALELAQKELEVRRDVYTWDALAWALCKNNRFEEAANASHQALSFGTKDAILLYHAGVIAQHMGHQDVAVADFHQALQINPHFHLLYADAAQHALDTASAALASNRSLHAAH